MKWHEDSEAWEEVLQRSKLPFEEIPEDKRGRELAELFFPSIGEDIRQYKGAVYALYGDNSVSEFSRLEHCARHYKLSPDKLREYISNNKKHGNGCYFVRGKVKKKHYIVKFKDSRYDIYRTITDVARMFSTSESTVLDWVRSRRFQTQGKGKGFKFLCIKE